MEGRKREGKKEPAIYNLNYNQYGLKLIVLAGGKYLCVCVCVGVCGCVCVFLWTVNVCVCVCVCVCIYICQCVFMGESIAGMRYEAPTFRQRERENREMITKFLTVGQTLAKAGYAEWNTLPWQLTVFTDWTTLHSRHVKRLGMTYSLTFVLSKSAAQDFSQDFRIGTPDIHMTFGVNWVCNSFSSHCILRNKNMDIRVSNSAMRYIEVRRHTPWPLVRCHGCWFMHSQFHHRDGTVFA